MFNKIDEIRYTITTTGSYLEDPRLKVVNKSTKNFSYLIKRDEVAVRTTIFNFHLRI